MIKSAILAAVAATLVSCAEPPRHRVAYQDDFLDRKQNPAGSDAADRHEDHTQRQQSRRERLEDFAYRRGTW